MLTDDVVTLRAPEPDDVDMMYLAENDVTLWNDGVTFAPVSRKQLWDYVENYDGNIYSAGQLRLVIESQGSVAGIIDLYDYDRINLRAYVGVTVLQPMRCKGIATRALRLLSDYCRRSLGMHQLAAVVRCDNVPSVRLFTSAGFTETGHFVDWIKRGNGYVSAIHYQKILDRDGHALP